jgi:hypothetical protein
MLQQLQRDYPSAPYGFFHVMNYEEARQQFWAGDASGEPEFRYRRAFTSAALERRKQSLLEMQTSNLDQAAASFVRKRLAETDLLLRLLALREHSQDIQAYSAYRQAMAELHGDFAPEILAGIFGYLRERAEATDTRARYQEILARTSAIAERQLYRPSAATFAHYSSLLKDARPLAPLMENSLVEPLDRQAALRYFARSLELSGAAAQGWRVRDSRVGTNIRISRHRQTVSVGQHFAPQSALRLKQTAAHEIFVHVRRAMLGNASEGASEREEGVAILAEQLLASRFMYRRLVRYLAAALAWGADGQLRTFRQTFAIIWRVFVVIGKYSEDEAKQQAFSECTRVFRGGIPRVAGVAYIKDKIYLEQNLAVWRDLETNLRGQQAFMDFLDGKERV